MKGGKNKINNHNNNKTNTIRIRPVIISEWKRDWSILIRQINERNERHKHYQRYNYVAAWNETHRGVSENRIE